MKKFWEWLLQDSILMLLQIMLTVSFAFMTGAVYGQGDFNSLYVWMAITIISFITIVLKWYSLERKGFRP